MTALVIVQDATEDGRGVERWPAHKVKATILAHKSTGVHIPDDPIVFNAAVLWGRGGHFRSIGVDVKYIIGEICVRLGLCLV